MRKIYKSYDEIDIPKDSNGNYIVDDPDTFDSTYEVQVVDRHHSNGAKITKERKVFVNMLVYTFKCKSCGKQQTRSFRNIHIEDHKTLLCQDCLNIKKRGYAHTYDNPEKQKYALKRMVEKYGGFGTAVPEIKAKSDKTNIERYGFACSLKNKEVDAVARANTRKTLGVDYPTQSAAFRETMADRLEEKTGHRRAMQNPETVNVYKENFTEKYGVDNPMKLQENVSKGKDTKRELYGDENFNNPEKAKDTKFDRYGDRNFNNREKAVQTKLERYRDANYVNREQAQKTMLDKLTIL